MILDPSQVAAENSEMVDRQTAWASAGFKQGKQVNVPKSR